MPKNKPNKGLLKRIRFTKSGRAKFRRAFGRHKRSHKSGSLLRSYRRPTYAKGCDMGRIRAMALTRLPKAARAKTKAAVAAAKAEATNKD